MNGIGPGRARGRRRVAAAIVDVCRNTTPDLPSHDATRRLFVDTVRHHRVSPLAHVLLRESEPDLAATLKPDRDGAMATHITASITLDAIDQLLDGLRWATFKGPVLSEHAHPAPGLRLYNDIDVLVSPHELRQATSRLMDAGWTVADFRDMLLNTATPGEMHWISPSGILIDLHWSMINMASTRRQFSVSTDAILERRSSSPLGLSSTWTLDHTDALTHVCLHAALTGAHRMLLILDVDQLARKTTDWDSVVARAHEWGAETAMAIVLARASALLNTPIPENLHRKLGVSTGLRMVTNAVDRLAPVPALRRDASMARLVARSARPGSNGTLTAVGTKGLRGVAQTVLASRGNWTRQFLEAVDAGTIDGDSLPLDVIRNMTIHRDDRIAELIGKHWGSVEGASTAQMQQQIERLSSVLRDGSGDPWEGKKIYTESCAKCHILFGEGGRIGPELTSYKRDDAMELLIHVVNPSAEIREGFETRLIITEDGRTATGFLVDSDSRVVVLRGADGQNVTVPRDQIDEMIEQRKSLMPEGLLDDLTDQQVRDLFAYLRSSQPLN
jgi:putative heme-binding domain-containing protein